MCEKIYSWLLHLYPERFRKEYGAAALQLFRDRFRTETGLAARLTFWLDVIGDLAFTVPREHGRLDAPLIASPAERCLDGAPVFHVCGSDAPRVGALIQGGALSLIVFGVISLAITRGGSYRPLRARLDGYHDRTYAHFLAFRGPAGVPTDETRAAAIVSGKQTTPGGLETGSQKPSGVWSKLHLLLSGSAFPGLQAQPSEGRQLPDTPAAEQLLQLIQARNTGDYQYVRRFYSDHFDGATPGTIEGNAATWVNMFRRFGPEDLSTLEVVESAQDRLVVLLKNRAGIWSRHRIEVAKAAPHKIKAYRVVSFSYQKPSLSMTERHQAFRR